MPFLMDEAHDLLSEEQALITAITNAQLVQHVRPPHDAKADFAGPPDHLGNLRQWIAVDVDDVVQEVHGNMNDAAQLVPVDEVDGEFVCDACVRGGDEAGEIDASEVARFKVVKRTLRAGVSRL